MKTQPIIAAHVDFGDPAAPRAPAFDDVYHSRDGALEQARHVFLRGNALPARWRDRRNFVVLETGFGLGHNFLATWQAWRSDPAASERLQFLSIEKHPLAHADLRRAHANSPLAEVAGRLVDAWPPLVPSLHRLAFEGGRVELLLAFGDVADWLPALVAPVDAFMLDGFAPAKNPAMWQPAVFASLARLAAAGATAATWSVAREVRDGLAAAGFEVERAPGFGTKREMTVARFAPRHVPAAPPGRAAARAGDTLIVGAALAGSALALALQERGLTCTLLDAAATAGDGGASNQRGGLFHGVHHADDGRHARFGRAAALHASAAVVEALAAGVTGRRDGFLRLERRADLGAMRMLLARLGLPPDYVQALDADEASARAGLPLASPAWCYPGGGWVAPAALARHWSSRAAGARRTSGVAVHELRRDGDRWLAVDAAGRTIGRASNVVVACGDATRALLARWNLPLAPVRGQTTWLPPGTPGLRAPRVPVADAGYVLATADGGVLCGASSERGDTDLAPRAADHHANLARLQRLTGSRPDVHAESLEGRTGLRLVAADRLPLAGPMPAIDAAAQRQPRLVEREPGLYVLGALGSRGLTWALLAARRLAAQIAGDAWPLEADLADAIDPARFMARDLRRSGS